VNGLAARLQLINIDATSLKAESISPGQCIFSNRWFCYGGGCEHRAIRDPSDVLFTIVDTEHLHAESQSSKGYSEDQDRSESSVSVR